MTKILTALLTIALSVCSAETVKQHGAFYSSKKLQQIRANLEKRGDAAELKKQAAERAAYWMGLNDENLWGLMFGPSITRSWMVWSDGYCPSCTNAVPMYQWKMDPQNNPWKVQCPHCAESFPKNDFGAFYKSGLNKAGVFEPALADRTLLFNAEHSGEQDPLRSYGVDDGQGFVKDGNRWRFIGAYLVYGQFKGLVLNGIKALSEAWVLTGDPRYARKAAILLDRVADVYPDFNYAKQGLVYESGGRDGYVSVWHDACEETREMVLAYDQVFEAVRDDRSLLEFLSRIAKAHGLANSKSSFADVQRNIEGRLLRDALDSPAKMHSNFPRREVAYTVIQAVLGWPENRADVERYMDDFIKPATAVDGVTGEKGLSGYTSYTISGLAALLAEFARADPEFLPRILERNPSLRQTWRFHIDTLCLDNFYPNSGDCGQFAAPAGGYVGAQFTKQTAPGLQPSMFTFFWQLYEATGDPAYVQILYRQNGDTTEGLPHDLCADDPASIREGVGRVITEQGPRPQLGSVHKASWHLAILRSGEGRNARALWMDYDSGGAHAHLDGMNIGLFACGADLLPDFGYPPVQHGGWSTPQVAWYLSPFAHNTVAVDGNQQRPGAGQCTLWADGRQFHLMRAAAPKLADVQEFTRTLVLADVSDTQFYVVDLFRVRSGGEHTKFVHGPPGQFTANALKLSAGQAYGHGALMRNFQADTNAQPGWSAEWNLPTNVFGGAPGFMKYTDFTEGIAAYTAEANVMPFTAPTPAGFWNAALLVRHRGPAPLQTAFLSTLEAYEKSPAIKSATRLAVRHEEGTACTNECVGLALTLADGRNDVFVASAAADMNRPMLVGSHQGTRPWDGLRVAGDCTWIRYGVNGQAQKAALCRSSELKTGSLAIGCDPGADLVEIEISPRVAKVVSGKQESLRTVSFGDK